MIESLVSGTLRSYEKELKRIYLLCQFESATEAIKLYHIVGTTTVMKEHCKSLFRMDIIKNCPAVTVEDINIAEKIFGLALSSMICDASQNQEKKLHLYPKEFIMKH